MLDGIIGQTDGVVSVGEIKFIWERGFLQNRRCSCGEPFLECLFWTEVISKVVPNWTDDEIEPLDAASRRTRTRHLPLMMYRSALQHFGRDLAGYRATLVELYQSILRTADAELVVDSSKFPSYAFLLKQDPSFDIQVVHLVRDPRAVAFSWTRDKVDPDAPGGERMIKLPSAVTGLYWNVWNVATERLCRLHGIPRMLVRYEDLVSAPRQVITEICNWAGIEGRQLPFVDDYTVNLSTNHAVSGNAIRFNQGHIRIRIDDAWQREMPRSQQMAAWVASWPTRRRYGYT